MGPSGGIYPCHQSQVLQRCPRVNCVASCGDRATVALDTLAGEAGRWPGWLRGQATTVAGTRVQGQPSVWLAARPSLDGADTLLRWC